MNNFRLFLILIPLFLIEFAGCQNDLKMTYHYADGSGNSYMIHPDSLVYSPVKPEFSSTGFYDGGEPANIPLSPEQYQNLSKLLDAGITNKENHIENRIKTSGSIQIAGENAGTYILKPKCPELEAIEAALRKLRE